MDSLEKKHENNLLSRKLRIILKENLEIIVINIPLQLHFSERNMGKN